MSHYENGGFYPMGGGAAIVKAMTNTIKNYGGEIRTGQAVKKIIIEGDKKKKAIGVELLSGEKIFADRIISNTDPGISYLKLIGKEHISPKLLKKLNKTKYSCTSLILFLVVDIDLRKAGMDSGNIWLMPNRDLDDFYDEMLREDLENVEEFQGMFISFPTLKDPTSFDGKYHSIEVVTFINYQTFKQFSDGDYSENPAYIAFKKSLSKKMIKGLEKVIPGVGNAIVHQELGTPMTNKHYIKSTEGNVYGTEKSLGFIGPFGHKAKSEIDNFYLCGSSIMAHGVAGSSYSGVQTAALILECSKNDLLKEDPSQHIRIYSSEDSSGYPNWLLNKIELKKNRVLSKAFDE
jgi:phytoene dehydrogenase-like protein